MVSAVLALDVILTDTKKKVWFSARVPRCKLMAWYSRHIPRCKVAVLVGQGLRPYLLHAQRIESTSNTDLHAHHESYS